MKKLWIILFFLILISACGEAPTTELDPIEPLPESRAEIDSLNQADEEASPTLTPPPAPSEVTEDDSSNNDSGSTTAETQPAETDEATAVSEEPTPEPVEESVAQESEEVVFATAPEPIVEEEMVEAVEEFESQLDEELKAESGSELSFGGFETIETRSISLADGSEIFVSYSVGFRPFDPLQNHFVLLAQPADDGWLELGRVELEFPDVVFPESVSTLEENGRLWIQVDSGVGAHGGCYDALLWDGATLSSSISHCHSSPAGAGRLEDVNGDNQIDIVLNNTNDYVFCYACGVRQPIFEVRTYNGEFWENVSLAPIESGDETAVTLNNEAVALANAGLWQDASLTLVELNSDNPTVVWNQTIVGLYEEAHVELISYSPFPLLQYVFYGDYESAISMIRTFPVADIFNIENNPLISGTPAEGWLDPLSESLISSADFALGEQPDLAEAHFIRGWATFLVEPDNPAVLMEIQLAATLAPTDPLYVDSLLLLSGE